MRTNIYRYQERIWYDGGQPSQSWDWHFSTSNDDASLTWFNTKAQQNKFIKEDAIKKKMVEEDHGGDELWPDTE